MSELQRAQTGSGHLSPERIEHRTWIKGRAATLLAHYWREDDDPALLAAMGRDWADVLEGLPQEYIQRACIQYQRDEPRKKPTPGAVYQIARALMPKPEVVVRSEPMPPAPVSQQEQADRQARMEQRRLAAQEIIRGSGLQIRMGCDDA
jgi:hypothetical protein